jgi:hypothetical protein
MIATEEDTEEDIEEDTEVTSEVNWKKSRVLVGSKG